MRWLEFCRNGAQGPLIVCGRTSDTIKRNIITPLQTLVGKGISFSVGKRELKIFNREIDVVGASDERAEGKIRGSEFAGALVDEISLLPENFVKMLLSRLSIPNAKLFATTNPDSPYHWLKRDIMDRRNDLNCKVFSFKLDDNPSLDEEYKRQLKKEYQGLWYQRFIEGKWVVAEGSIYDFFEEETHIIDNPGIGSEYIVGVDYGTTNPCVFVLIGYNSSNYPNMWLEKEYYYDSQKEMRQKSDSEYAEDFMDFLEGIHPTAIYIDPSAASFKQELRRNGVSNIFDATNDVVPGIRYQAQLLMNGTYKICRSCPETIKEYSNYLWDKKASERGMDKPIKNNDHTKDAERYALYTHFFKRTEKSMTERDALDLERMYYSRI